MSTSVIEPGTRLAGRYRLEERISDSGGSAQWKAIDEILARAVAVRTFDPEFPRVAEVVTSARAAARLTDPRLTQVFDADDSGESAYVVSEWVSGETLEQMLAKAPLEPGRAATLLYEASEAIAAAHAAGLAHLCLSPRDLVWTTGGTVKLLGVATAAALADVYSDDPAREDVRGLGGLLYAALTAHWPGEPKLSALPAAPAADGVVRAPRQVQAGISHAVDAIVCRALGLQVPGQEPLTTPADFAKAMRGVPRTPLPLFAGLGGVHSPAPSAPTRPAHAPGAPAASTRAARPAAPASHHQAPQQPRRRGAAPAPAPHAPRTRHDSVPPPTAPVGVPGTRSAPRSPLNRALLGVAAAAATVIVGLSAWAIGNAGGSSDKGTDKAGVTDPGRSSAPPSPTATKLSAQGATALEDPKRGSHDTSIAKNPEAVLDGKSSTQWQTQTYKSSNFGNLSNGFGVVLDMGKQVKVDHVLVDAPVSTSVPIQLRVGDGNSLGALRVVGQEQGSGQFTIKATREARGQYVLIWFTNPVPPGFKAKLNDVTVYGTAG
ncbi:protein kinase family protein [Actinomadura miaoliensis]|uniref:Protein kinase family protein n=1 Tax=Actinomadura miaoliensis TaxID=430685 RepID=A0ABP7V8I3_9ACTN